MRTRLWMTLAIFSMSCLMAGLVWWYRSLNAGNLAESLPKSTATERPYIAERMCAECHADQATDHQTSGHADTFHATVKYEVARWLAGQTFDDPERPYSYEYHFDEATGLSVSIPKQFGDDRFQLPYVLGSGHHALTFLSLMPDRLGDTTGIEHRVSLYRNKDGWELDLTPGHRIHLLQQEVEHFGKVLRGDKLTSCIRCHTTHGEIVGQQIENLSPHVGCQSCHGPGREHATAMKDMEYNADDKYTEFTRQSAREEVEMCGRCHRLAHSDSDAEVSPNDIRIVRFQSIGLVQSRCFTQSEGQLRCTTCHDPHRTVSRDPMHYIDRCLGCHDDTAAPTCPNSPQSNCIACHMPAIDIHRGIAFHDHWIRVRTDLSDATSAQTGDE